MKKFIFFLLYFCLQQSLFAQNCGTDEMHAKRMANENGYAQNFEQTQAYFQNILSYQNAHTLASVNQRKTSVNSCDSTYTVPVVVHIIHTGQPIGTGYNVSDATVQNAIDNLNLVYQNAIISNGTYPSVDIGLQFALAKRDPNNAPTTGILRVNAASLSAYVSNGVNLNGSSGISDATLKALSYWNSQEYYNIWIVNGIDGLPSAWGGYATYPLNPPSNTDGTVIAYNALTSALAHEIGHAWNLNHTFEGSSGTTCAPNANCNTDGDKICDTEPHLQSECGSTSSCTTSSIANTVKNYMSYCSSRDRFTPQQRVRMRNALVYLRPYFLFSEKLVPTGATTEVGITDLLTPDGILCSNSAPVIVVKNYGTSNLTNVQISAYLNGNLQYTNTFSLSLAQNQSDTLSLGAITAGLGTHLLRIEISGINGGGIDSYVANNQVCTNIKYNPIQNNFPYCTDFNVGAKPVNWTYLNESFIDTVTLAACTLHNKALRIQNFSPASNVERAIYSDEIDLTNTSFARLSFDIAHRKPYFCNQQAILKVEISSDCGLTYTNVYHKNSSYNTSNPSCGVAATALPLHTVAPPANNSSDYIPANDNEWRKDSINLAAFIGQKIRIKFSETLNSNSSQSLYLDNICVVACALQVSINATNLTCNIQNGAANGSATALVSGNTGTVTYNWSNSQNTATIGNLSAGNYTCTVTDALGCQATASSTITQPSPFSVNLQVFGGNTTVCQGDTLLLTTPYSPNYSYTWLQNNNVIAGANISYYNTTTNGNYQVVVTNANNCKDTSNLITTTLLSSPTATITNTNSLTVCAGGSVTLNANTGANLSYQWQNNGNNIVGANSSSYTTTTSGIYTVVVTNANNCSTTSLSKAVTVLSVPTATITPTGPTTICAFAGGVPLNTTLVGGQTCQWLLNGANIPNANTSTYTCSQTGNYGLIVTNANGCKDTTYTTVTLNPMPNVSITPAGATTFCQGGSVQLSANSTISFSSIWTMNGAQVASSNTYTATQTGIYYVIATSTANCKDSSSINVTVNPLPTPTVTYSNLILGTQPYNSYQWFLNGNALSGANNQTYAPTLNGNYSVYVTNSNNCGDTSAQFLLTNVQIEPTKMSLFSVYPNPSSNHIFIKYADIKDPTSLYIRNILGQIIHSQIINKEVTEIDLASYPNGIYELEMKDAKGLRLGTVKFVKE